MGTRRALTRSHSEAAITLRMAFRWRIFISCSWRGDDSVTTTNTRTVRSTRCAESVCNVRTFHLSARPARRPSALMLAIPSTSASSKSHSYCDRALSASMICCSSNRSIPVSALAKSVSLGLAMC